MEGCEGIRSAIDIKKAYDSLSLDFPLTSLELYGFGVSFISWIKTFYKNITNSVAYSGYFTPSFNVKWGVRQGDPLSPSLFIIVLELLAISIRNNRQIN